MSEKIEVQAGAILIPVYVIGCALIICIGFSAGAIVDAIRELTAVMEAILELSR